MDNESPTLIEWIIPYPGGEVVKAATHRDAKIQFLRFGYTQEEIATMITVHEYTDGGKIKLTYK